MKTQRQPLSRERVVEAAVALADAQGLGALTMRRLAQDLGVEAMTLYYHVGRKDALLDAIVDVVVREIELPPPELDWRAAIRRTAISAHDVLVRHRWAAHLILSSTGPNAARLRYMDAVLGTFRRGGFSADLTDHAYHALDSHVMGFTLWQVSMDLPDDEELRTLAGAFLDQLPADELPHLVEHVHQHLKPRDPDDEGEFVFGLDLLLDGLQRIRDAR